VASTELWVDTFDLDRSWRLSPKVGLRPEPFGALAYHFDTRRLLFVKSNDLVALIESLENYPSAQAAVDAAVTSSSRGSLITALTSLAEAGIIEETL